MNINIFYNKPMEEKSYNPRDEEIAARIKERAEIFNDLCKNYPLSLGTFFDLLLLFFNFILNLMTVIPFG